MEDLRTGKVLKGTSYVIPSSQKEIGEGTFGKVYRIYNLSRPCDDLAVKVISKQSLSGKRRSPSQLSQEDLIRREIEVIERLPECVNLARYEKFCLESTSSFYFIIEFCNGGDLQSEMIMRSQSASSIYSEEEIADFLA